MAATAEAYTAILPDAAHEQSGLAAQEVYAGSFNAHRRFEAARRLASVACQAEVAPDESQKAQDALEAERQYGLRDYRYGVTEMANSDKEFNNLDIDTPPERRKVINGRVRAVNGEAITSIVERGEAAAKKLADHDPKMWFEYVRAQGDTVVAKRSERLAVGWTHLAPSMNPQEAMERHPEITDKYGYTDVMYWQRYSRTSEDAMDTGTHSAAMSDMKVWSGVVKDFLNLEIPQGTPADEWIRHGIDLECSAQEADQLIRDMRAEYYERIGLTEKRHSVSGYVEQNSDVVEQIFDAYNPSLSEAIVSGDNNDTMSSLASSILQTEAVKKLEPEVRKDLIAVANSNKFDEDMGQTMHSILRYVAVEELRKGLPDFISGANPEASPAYQTFTAEPTMLRRQPPANMPLPIPLEILNRRMAANLQSGVENKRSYSGCSFQIKLAAEGETSVDALGNVTRSDRQSAYGGWGGGGGRRAREQMSKTGKINCIKCKASVDEREAKKVKGHLRCTSCKYEIDVCDNNRVVHKSEQPEKSAKRFAVKKSVELNPAVSLQEKRRAKQAKAAKNIMNKLRPVDGTQALRERAA